MKSIPSIYQAEIRIGRAWQWLMKTEPARGDNPRWKTFRRIRDRLRPFRLPLSTRVEAILCGMSGSRMSESATMLLKENLK